MKLLPITVALSAALTPVMAEAAFSGPMLGAADFPRASNPRVNVPVCFIETPSGTTFDLVSLCGANVAPQNTNPAAGNPANAPANNPNAGNPAAAPNPNSITRDAAGAPITTPAGTANPNNPNNLNPGTSPNTAPNNINPGTSPNLTPNSPLSPTGGNAGDSNGDLVPNRNLNLPRVPPSSFGPGGVAPTRDAIDGPR
ncbi:MAG: hypothetical protein WBA89_11740 [Microcoleus sp.]|uniref:hypothetical protein n=1 Tax=Microcoleus sp. TaxID=44472 RepID=UPI003C7385A3